MTQKELQRVQVLVRVREGQLPLTNAAAALGVCYRQALRLKAAFVARGPQGLIHGNLGRAPPNRIDDQTRRRILELAENTYSGFNDVHCAEMLAEREGISIGRETLRRLLRASGRAPKRSRRLKKYHRRRERSPSKGLMLLWDGSPHPWFGPDHPSCTLMLAIDDADSEAVCAFFVAQETSEAYLRLLRGILQRRGIPVTIYMDRHGSLKRNDSHWSLQEQLAGERNPTQVGMALRDLGIKPIFALSAQAKGRVERAFDTFQDRLVPELGLANICSIQEANRFLTKQFLPRFNRRFASKNTATSSSYRSAAGLDLKYILSFRYPATVSNDNTVSVGGLLIQIPKDTTCRGYAKAKVDVRQHLDGTWSVYYHEKCIARKSATPFTEPLRYRRKGFEKTTKAADQEILIYSPRFSPSPCDIFAGQLL
jgi:transposase